MLKGYQNSSPTPTRAGTVASSPQTSLKVNVKVAHPLMSDVRSDDFTIRVESPGTDFANPKVKLSTKFEADESIKSTLDFTFDGDDGHQLTSVGDPGMPYSKNKKLQVIACNGDGAVCVSSGADSDPEWMPPNGSSVFGCKSRKFAWFDLRECD